LTNLFVDEHYIPRSVCKWFRKKFLDRFSIRFDDHPQRIRRRMAGLERSHQSIVLPAGDSMKSVAYHVIGVVKDFNFSSMHDKVGPLVMNMGDNRSSLAVRLAAAILSLQSSDRGQMEAMATECLYLYLYGRRL